MTAHPSVLVVAPDCQGPGARGVAATAEVTVVEKSRGRGRLATRRLGPALRPRRPVLTPVPCSPASSQNGSGPACRSVVQRTLEPEARRWTTATSATGCTGHDRPGKHEPGTARVTGTCVARLEVEGARWRASPTPARRSTPSPWCSPHRAQSLASSRRRVALSDADRHTLEPSPTTAAWRCSPCSMHRAVSPRPAPCAGQERSTGWPTPSEGHLGGARLTVHAAGGVQPCALGDTDADVCAALLAARAAVGCLGRRGDVQRWRYAKPTSLHTDRFLMARGSPRCSLPGTPRQRLSRGRPLGHGGRLGVTPVGRGQHGTTCVGERSANLNPSPDPHQARCGCFM